MLVILTYYISIFTYKYIFRNLYLDIYYLKQIVHHELETSGSSRNKDSTFWRSSDIDPEVHPGIGKKMKEQSFKCLQIDCLPIWLNY